MTQKYISLTKLVLPFYDPVLTILDYTESRTSCGNSDGDSILKYFDYYIRRSCLSFLISWQKLFWENRKKNLWKKYFCVDAREKKSFFLCCVCVLFCSFFYQFCFLNLKFKSIYFHSTLESSKKQKNFMPILFFSEKFF